MRIAIQTLGTRLALRLRAQGHEVQIAAPEQYEALATERGVSYAALPAELLALIDTPEGKAALEEFSSSKRTPSEIKTYPDAIADMLGAYIQALMRN